MQKRQISLLALGLCALLGLIMSLMPPSAEASTIVVNTGPAGPTGGNIYISGSGNNLSVTGSADGSGVTGLYSGSNGTFTVNPDGTITITGSIEVTTADGDTGFLSQETGLPDGTPPEYEIYWLSKRPTQTVTVARIPELSTWAMLAIGFAGIGFVTHRRRRSSRLVIRPLAFK